MRNSGKLLIIAILAVAVLMAGAGWWFRYSATHRVAEFWGTEQTVLIRDAPKVTLFRRATADVIRLASEDPVRAALDDSAFDISQARGLLHLRNALLEDRSFVWPEAERWPAWPNDGAHWLLSFYDPESGRTAILMFSEDCRHASAHKPRLLAYELTTISTEPIAAGLRKIFAEFAADGDNERPTTTR